MIILDGQQPSPRGTPANAILAATIQQGRPRPANDTWIAACALAYGLPLATLNTKDFKDFAEHGGLNLIIQAGYCTGYEQCPVQNSQPKLRVVHELGLRWSG